MTIPKFLTAYDRTAQVITPTPSGEEEEPVYSYVKRNNSEVKVLEKTGTTNVWEKIQEQLEDTKIENILKRAAAGDNTMFRPDGIYEDCTQYPDNIHDQTKLMETAYNNLATDIANAQEAQQNEQEHGTTLQQHTENQHQAQQVRHEQEPQNNV